MAKYRAIELAAETVAEADPQLFPRSPQEFCQRQSQSFPSTLMHRRHGHQTTRLIS
ncbi:hypothetical protein P7K49_014446, partial [Saguinus oedipus]